MITDFILFGGRSVGRTPGRDGETRIFGRRHKNIANELPEYTGMQAAADLALDPGGDHERRHGHEEADRDFAQRGEFENAVKARIDHIREERDEDQIRMELTACSCEDSQLSPANAGSFCPPATPSGWKV